MGIELPLPKGAQLPNFRPMSVAAKWLDGSRCHLLYGARPRPRRLCVRWRPSPPPQKGGRAPSKFSAHVYCGQMAGWIKMPLGTKVGLSPDDSVLDGDLAPHKGGGAPSRIFRPFLLWLNGWMRQAATWYGGRPQPKGLCVRWGPSPPLPKKEAEPGGQAPPIFGPCLLWPNG